MSMKEDILRFYKDGDMLNKLIFINVCAFVVVGIGFGILKLFRIDTSLCVSLLTLSSSLKATLLKPWTLITYAFLHFEFIHFIINMLMLNWFGRIFLSSFTQRDLVGLYLIGALAGGLTYLLSYTFLPLMENSQGALCGASASIMGIILAIASNSPNREVRLALIGNIRLKWIAAVAIAFSLLNVASENAGGNLSHLGGALAGYLFTRYYSKGINITRWINSIMDKCVNLFNTATSKKSKFSYKMGSQSNGSSKAQTRTMTDEEYNMQRRRDEEEIDIILDKIKKSGYESLSKEEKERLFRAGNRK